MFSKKDGKPANERRSVSADTLALGLAEEHVDRPLMTGFEKLEREIENYLGFFAIARES